MRAYQAGYLRTDTSPASVLALVRLSRATIAGRMADDYDPILPPIQADDGHSQITQAVDSLTIRHCERFPWPGRHRGSVQEAIPRRNGGLRFATVANRRCTQNLSVDYTVHSRLTSLEAS